MLFQFGVCIVTFLEPVTRWESNEKATAYHSEAPDYTPDVSSCCSIFSFLCIFSIYAYDSFVLFLLVIEMVSLLATSAVGHVFES